MGRKKSAIQEHHISYNLEETVIVYTGEHSVLTRLQWYCSKRRPSKGFVKALKKWLKQHEHRAVELTKPK